MTAFLPAVHDSQAPPIVPTTMRQAPTCVEASISAAGLNLEVAQHARADFVRSAACAQQLPPCTAIPRTITRMTYAAPAVAPVLILDPRPLQVSSPIPTPSHHFAYASIQNPGQEMVRVQRSLLQEHATEDNVDLEAWSVGHVVWDFVNRETLERTLRIRFASSEEQDICEGAVHRLTKRIAQRLDSCPAEPPPTLQAHISSALSPPLEYVGHPSSADTFSLSSSSSSWTEQEGHSEATHTVSEATDTDSEATHTDSKAIHTNSSVEEGPESVARNCLDGLRPANADLNDSDATQSQPEVDKLRRRTLRTWEHRSAAAMTGGVRGGSVGYGTHRAAPRQPSAGRGLRGRRATRVPGRGRGQRARPLQEAGSEGEAAAVTLLIEESPDSWYKPPTSRGKRGRVGPRSGRAR
jgi:hypothetical protein